MDQKETIRRKWIGVLIMTLSTIGFFTLSFYFNQFGTKIDYNNLNYVLRSFGAAILLPLGLYFGLYFYGGKKIALQIGGGALVLLVLAFLIGYILHH